MPPKIQDKKYLEAIYLVPKHPTREHELASPGNYMQQESDIVPREEFLLGHVVEMPIGAFEFQIPHTNIFSLPSIKKFNAGNKFDFISLSNCQTNH